MRRFLVQFWRSPEVITYDVMGICAKSREIVEDWLKAHRVDYGEIVVDNFDYKTYGIVFEDDIILNIV